jgi:hypothetical protein
MELVNPAEKVCCMFTPDTENIFSKGVEFVNISPNM